MAVRHLMMLWHMLLALAFSGLPGVVCRVCFAGALWQGCSIRPAKIAYVAWDCDCHSLRCVQSVFEAFVGVRAAGPHAH